MSIASCLTDIPHPGEFIREEIEARGWSQRDFAFILGVPEQTVNLILGGKRGVSPEMAKALAKAFDVSAEYFANLQKMYEMANAREADPAIERRALLQGSYPIREMIRRGWLEDTDVDLLEAQMMRFFRVNDVVQIPYLAHAARKADYTETTPAQLAWLFRVKQIAEQMVVPLYSESKLKTLVAELPRYMTDPEEVRHIPRLLTDCGVRFVVVETLPKANIDGVCFWLDDAPVIGMTTRFDRIDNFWFVLGHECAHALNGDGRKEPVVDVELEGEAAGQGESLPPEERRANALAANLCVPSDDLESFYIRKNPYFYERDVLGFARRLQRHPGIVVGQLQRRMNRYDYLTKYKTKIRQFLLPASMVDGWGVAAPVTL